jgi:hypothetical protein
VLIEAGQKKNFLSQAAVRSRDHVRDDLFVGVAEMRLAVDVINRGGDVKPFAHYRTASLADKRGNGNLPRFVVNLACSGRRRTRRISMRVNAIIMLRILGCRGKPAMNKHRMNKELSSFAARLRELSTIASPQAARNRQSAILRAWNCSRFNLKTIPPTGKSARRAGGRRKVVEHWTQIPAVPTARSRNGADFASRRKNAPQFFIPAARRNKSPAAIFIAESLAVYEASLWSWWKWFGNFRSLNQRIVDSGIVADFDAAAGTSPHSSLVHMFETVRQKIGGASVPASPDVRQTGGRWLMDVGFRCRARGAG